MIAPWPDSDVRSALGVDGTAARTFSTVSTDTRTLTQDALFVALRGERFDAHEFLAQAQERGATGAVVDHVPAGAPDTLTYYVVADTLVALGQLARFRRRQLDARVCAITGSNGKTTTKELTRAALAARYRVHATTGNLNNLIGAPLTILSTPDDAEILILELGTNAPGEIARLGAIAEPDAVLITGISEEHLEGLGDIEGVLREETALLPALAHDAVVIVADEPDILPARARELVPQTQVAGWTSLADVNLRAEDVRLSHAGEVSFRWRDLAVQLPLRGRHNARNALLALGLALAWDVDAQSAVNGLRETRGARMRGELHHIGDLTVIADCYNSNPASLEAAIDLLESMPRRGGRVAVLGSMLELGGGSAEIHARAAERIAHSDVDMIVATGLFAPAFEPHGSALGERLIRADDALAAWEPLSQRLRGDEVVLLKGSRGVALERLLPRFEERWSATGSDDAAPTHGA